MAAFSGLEDMDELAAKKKHQQEQELMILFTCLTARLRVV